MQYLVLKHILRNGQLRIPRSIYVSRLLIAKVEIAVSVATGTLPSFRYTRLAKAGIGQR